VSATESSVGRPAPGWGRRFPRDEKIFLILILATTIAMTAFAIGWVIWGSQNVPTTTQRVTPKEFAGQVQAFVDRYGAEDGKAWVPPGDDAYMLATRYTWYPELVLETGKRYTIWISAGDVLHGFSLVGGHQNLNLEIAPNHSFGVNLTVGDPGRYRIVCNEYCGLGHQEMTSFINVVTPAEMAAHPPKEAAGAGTGTAGGTAPGGEVLKVSADPSGKLAYDVSELSAPAGKVTISMANPSPLPHNVAIKDGGVDVKGPVVTTGGTSTVAAELEAGTYTFYCSVPGHEAAGMKGTLTVK